MYRDETGWRHIEQWCAQQLDRWPIPHERRTVRAGGVSTHVVAAGVGGRTVVCVPGTNFNAATSLPLATALATAGYRAVLLDVPGQPGLSGGHRPPSRGSLAWQGCWLSSVLEDLGGDSVTVLGHSLGAAIAMSSASPRISRLVLLSPGGLSKLHVSPRVLAASTAWYLHPNHRHSTRLLQLMMAPEQRPRDELVEWMTLVARHCRSSASPQTVARRPDMPCTVAVGRHDTFLPTRRLTSAVRRLLNAQLEVIQDAGHLVADEQPDAVADLVDRASRSHDY